MNSVALVSGRFASGRRLISSQMNYVLPVPKPFRRVREGLEQSKPIPISQGSVFSPSSMRFRILGDGNRSRTVTRSFAGCRVACTIPAHYAPRLTELLRHEGAEVLWYPTIVTEFTDQTRNELETAIKQLYDSSLSGVAFTSRAGIQAFSVALNGRKLPEDPSFTVAALGKDAEHLIELDMVALDKVLTPATPTPAALVEALGEGKGKKILCPIPLVVDLEEPPVVPHFLRELAMRGWTPVRVNAYVTRWMGRNCVEVLLGSGIKALIFTSTAEIEGLIKSLELLEEAPGNWRKRKSRTFLVATHGPVTAQGAHRLGVEVDVVGAKFDSFSGVVAQLAARVACDQEQHRMKSLTRAHPIITHTRT